MYICMCTYIYIYICYLCQGALGSRRQAQQKIEHDRTINKTYGQFS